MKGGHPPRRACVIAHNHSESAFASDTLSTSQETYSEESRDDVIKSSQDTPPKAKQATVLETWLRVGFIVKSLDYTLLVGLDDLLLVLHKYEAVRCGLINNLACMTYVFFVLLHEWTC